MTTLKEKFGKLFMRGRDTTEFEKIADEFAIDFAEWLYKWDNTRLPNGNWILGLGVKAYTSEEVLLKYKKEKGL